MPPHSQRPSLHLPAHRTPPTLKSWVLTTPKGLGGCDVQLRPPSPLTTLSPSPPPSDQTLSPACYVQGGDGREDSASARPSRPPTLEGGVGGPKPHRVDASRRGHSARRDGRGSADGHLRPGGDEVDAVHGGGDWVDPSRHAHHRRHPQPDDQEAVHNADRRQRPRGRLPVAVRGEGRQAQLEGGPQAWDAGASQPRRPYRLACGLPTRMHAA